MEHSKYKKTYVFLNLTLIILLSELSSNDIVSLLNTKKITLINLVNRPGVQKDLSVIELQPLHSNIVELLETF